MAITFKELLRSRFFRDFEVVAGRFGLERKVGLVLTCEENLSEKNSYTFLINMKYHKKDVSSGFVKTIIKMRYSGLGIQFQDSEFTNLEELKSLCDKANFPLIRIPKDIEYMEIVRNVDVACVDSRVQELCKIIDIKDNYDHKTKIARTISSLFREINRDVKIYDLLSGHIIMASGAVLKNVKIEEYEKIWNPKSEFTKKSIADKIQMYYLINDNLDGNKEFIVMPITINNKELAVMVIEGRGIEKDYNALYSIKISYLVILSEYKSAYSEIASENKMRDKMILDAVKNKLEVDNPLFIKYFGKDKMRPFTAVAIRQFTSDLNMFMRRERIERCIYNHLSKRDVYLGILDNNEMALLVAQDREKNEPLQEVMKSIIIDLEKDMERAKFCCGLNEEYTGIEKLSKSYELSVLCLNNGSIIMKEENVFTKEELGPFIFFDLDRVKREGENLYRQNIMPLLKEGEGCELLHTLKEYMDCNLSVSETAKRNFLHSNTIRYRINKIEKILDISLKDPFTRLKLEIILMFC